jgi:hypothetical protein
MKEFDPAIIEYMQDQLPEILESRDYALANDDFESEYLDGIVMAYQHIIDKFSYEAS